jgi:hypothetical protein
VSTPDVITTVEEKNSTMPSVSRVLDFETARMVHPLVSEVTDVPPSSACLTAAGFSTTGSLLTHHMKGAMGFSLPIGSKSSSLPTKPS